MKNIKKISLFVACGVVALLTACSGGGPSAAAEKFYDNFAQGNYEEAKEYCTESTKAIVDMAVGFGHKATEDFKTEIVKDSIDGDNAWVWYIDEKGKEDKMTLKKVDGEWLVDIKK